MANHSLKINERYKIVSNPAEPSVSIVTTTEPDLWQDALNSVKRYDYYHLQSYHRLAELQGEGDAVMFVYHEADITIIYPMLLQDISQSFPSSNAYGLKDATSVHGYAGPLASSDYVPDDVKRRFMYYLLEFLRSEKVVTAFTRIHPLIGRADLLDCGVGEIVDIGVTVSTDLTRSREDRFSAFRSDHRRNIRNLRKQDYRFEEAGLDLIDDFIDIYYYTLDKVGAKSYSYYKRSYFHYLLEDMSDIMHLFVCKDKDTIAWAGIFSICSGIICFLYGGTAPEYRGIAITKLMLDETMQWASERGAYVMHLGGGVRAQRDDLYMFKMGFGGKEHPFLAWRYVIDEENYYKLASEARQIAGPDVDENYFPIYRHPLIKESRSSSE